MRTDRLPPQDVDTEQALLGALLIGHEFPGLADADVEEIRAIVSPGAFYTPQHARVYRAILDTVDADEPVNRLAVLRRLEQVDNQSDWGQILGTLRINAEPANGPFYARMLRGLWQKRELIRAAHQLEEDAYAPLGDANDIIATLTKRVDAIEQLASGDQEVRREAELLQSFENPRNSPEDRIPINIGALGQALDGGLDRGTLTVVGARPSAGKTSLGLGLCVNVSRATGGTASLFVSLEMNARQIAARLLSMRSGLPVRRIRSGDVGDDEFLPARASAVQQAQQGYPVYVLDSTRDLRMIAAHVRRCVRKQNVGLACVDYLGLCQMAGTYERHDLKIGAMTGLLKGLASDLNIAVIVMAQLSRASDRESRRPRLSDLRDSGNIEQDADCVILIHKEDQQTGPVAETTLIIAKMRQGETGEAALDYDKRRMSYQARYVGPMPSMFAGESRSAV